MSAFIDIAKDSAVTTLTFNRPDKKNAILMSMYAEAADALVAADADPDVRVVVITGAGDSFTAGNDLKDFLNDPPRDVNAPVFQFMRALSRCRKPVIAAVNGLAVGIGTTILLHCDLIYAVPSATFQMPFVSLGVVPEFASSLLVPQRLGRARAAEILFLGAPFTAARALELGFVNAVVAPEALRETVAATAQALASKPPGALRDAKLLLFGDTAAVDARIAQEAELFSARLRTPEFKEAASAFLEKRAPDFSKFS